MGGTRQGVVADAREAAATGAEQGPDEDDGGLDLTRLYRAKDKPMVYSWREFPFDDLPEEVRVELAPFQKPGKKLVLRVLQRRLGHMDDTRIAREASDEESGMGEPMEVLQAVIDRTVEESNFGLPHNPISRLDCPNFAWWLYEWLGAKECMHRMTTISARLVRAKKKPSSSSRAKRRTRT